MKGKRKANIEIGQRAYKEILRLFPDKSIPKIAILLGCKRQTIQEWDEGRAPSAIFLARMIELGADVNWILTGRRKKNL